LAAPLVIAHRGDSAHRPENTLAAMAGALELGVSAVELDVQLTRDGHAVVIHDPTISPIPTDGFFARQLNTVLDTCDVVVAIVVMSGCEP